MTPALQQPDRAPRVFVSYSWDSDDHRRWVLAFATELVKCGIEVRLDQWHLHPGQDKTYFMEQSVTKSDYVLLVCTPTYAQKANDRRAGVGYEAMIVTGVLASCVLSEKFIPILRTGELEEATPIWLGTRIGVDMRGDACSPEVFEGLLRTLHGQVARPPERGPRPAFAQADAPSLAFTQPSAPRTSAAQPRSSVPLELPPAAEQFFGRQTELAKLTERLRSRRSTAVVADAGFGKTALAARAIREVTGETLQSLAASPYPDGVLFLDFYTLEGLADRAWDALANRLAGPDAWSDRPARERAQKAVNGRNILVVVEGAEEAHGRDGHPTVPELLSVLAPENRYLLLTRISDQIDPTRIVALPETLDLVDAGNLFDSLTCSTVTGEARDEALRLLDGHPLALTWAAKRLLYADDAPEAFIADWKAARLPGLSDPENAKHTLGWLYGRSVRGLSSAERQALAAAAMLSFAPVPVSAIAAALDVDEITARDLLRLLTRHALLRPAKDRAWQFTHVLGYSFARQETGSHTALRMGLGKWLHAQLAQALAQDDTPGTISIVRLLEHLDALLRMDDDQSLWQPLVEDVLYDFSQRIVVLGRLGQAMVSIDSAEAWFARLSAEGAEEPYWQRERSELVSRKCDILVQQGNLTRALHGYQDSLQVRRRLAQADPSNTEWQRDLAVSLNEVGDILAQQGDLAGALDSYRDALTIRQKLAQTAPSNTRWQRDLSVSLNKVGDILAQQGDLAGALDSYRDALTIRQQLAQTDPSNTQWQRNLSVSLERVGNILAQQGDLAGALDSYRDALTIRQKLAQTAPSNTRWQRDLSVSLNKVGDILAQQGDLVGALDSYSDSLTIAQRLTQTDPSNTGWQRDLSVGLNKVGDILAQQGDLVGALDSYSDSLTIAQRLTQTDPSNTEWQRGLSYTLTQLALLHERQRERARALLYAEESLRIDERLAALDPTNITWQNDVQFSRALVGRLTD